MDCVCVCVVMFAQIFEGFHVCDTHIHPHTLSLLSTHTQIRTNTREHAFLEMSYHFQARISGGIHLWDTLVHTLSLSYIVRLINILICVTHSYVCHGLFIHMTWLNHVCTMTCWYEWHDSSMCVHTYEWVPQNMADTYVLSIYICGLFMWLDSIIYVWLLDVRGMTELRLTQLRLTELRLTELRLTELRLIALRLIAGANDLDDTNERRKQQSSMCANKTWKSHVKIRWDHFVRVYCKSVSQMSMHFHTKLGDYSSRSSSKTQWRSSSNSSNQPNLPLTSICWWIVFVDEFTIHQQTLVAPKMQGTHTNCWPYLCIVGDLQKVRDSYNKFVTHATIRDAGTHDSAESRARRRLANCFFFRRTRPLCRTWCVCNIWCHVWHVTWLVYMYVTWLIHIYVTWLIPIYVTWLIHICVTWLVHVWLLYVFDMTRSSKYVVARRAPCSGPSLPPLCLSLHFVSLSASSPWPKTCVLTHVWLHDVRDFSIYVAWHYFCDVCDMNQLYICDSLMCVVWLSWHGSIIYVWLLDVCGMTELRLVAARMTPSPPLMCLTWLICVTWLLYVWLVYVCDITPFKLEIIGAYFFNYTMNPFFWLLYDMT